MVSVSLWVVLQSAVSRVAKCCESCCKVLWVVLQSAVSRVAKCCESCSKVRRHVANVNLLLTSLFKIFQISFHSLGLIYASMHTSLGRSKPSPWYRMVTVGAAIKLAAMTGRQISQNCSEFSPTGTIRYQGEGFDTHTSSGEISPKPSPPCWMHFKYRNTQKYTHTHIHTYTRIHVCVYTYVCIHTYMHTLALRTSEPSPSCTSHLT